MTALSVQPDHVEALLNRGNALSELRLTLTSPSMTMRFPERTSSSAAPTLLQWAKIVANTVGVVQTERLNKVGIIPVGQTLELVVLEWRGPRSVL